MTPTLLLVVHGTRDPNGTSVAQALTRQVAENAGAPVRLGFADVLHPDAGQVAATIEGPIVVVPAFLAAGYHVHVDIPAQLAHTGRTAVPLAQARPDTLEDPRAAIITDALGEDDRLITTAAHRLHQAGWRPADAEARGPRERARRLARRQTAPAPLCPGGEGPTSSRSALTPGRSP